MLASLARAALCAVGLLLAAPTAFAQSNVLFIFDASGSMKKEIDGKRRIDVAKEAFFKTVLSMPQSARTGLMVFGAQRAKDCSDIAVVSPVGSGAPGLVYRRIYTAFKATQREFSTELPA